MKKEKLSELNEDDGTSPVSVLLTVLSSQEAIDAGVRIELLSISDRTHFKIWIGNALENDTEGDGM